MNQVVSMLDLDQFNAQPLQRDPFDYLILPGFIRQGVLAAISRDFPKITQPGSFPSDSLQLSGAFRQFLDELEGDAFRHAVEQNLTST
jgi:hypothetical protein